MTGPRSFRNLSSSAQTSILSAKAVFWQRWAAPVFALLMCWGWSNSDALAGGGYNFKKYGLGFSLGIQNTFNQTGDPAATPIGSRYNLGYGVGPGASIGVQGSWEFAQNVSLGLETHISFHSCATPTRDPKATPQTICSKDHPTPIMFAAFTNLSYLFLQDDFRPYLSLGVGVWNSIGLVNAASTAFGPTATLGFHWYFAESLALGVRARYGLQVVVESTQLSVFHQIVGVATFMAYL